MAIVRKSTFQKAAKMLIGKGGIFSDLLQTCVITKTLSIDYDTSKPIVKTQYLQMVKVGDLENNIDLRMIKNSDIEIIGLFQDLNFDVSVNDTTFSFDGIVYSFLSKEVDPAKATITLIGKK